MIIEEAEEHALLLVAVASGYSRQAVEKRLGR
jgi:hypothetical protein